jgi:hypothetical protein
MYSRGGGHMATCWPPAKRRPRYRDGVANGEAETKRTASELRWLRVHDYLQRNRHELAVRAAEEYPAGSRVAGTPLLAAPEWVPAAPVPLESIRLELHRTAPVPRVTDVAAVAPVLFPERTGAPAYRRHCDVIGVLAPPAIFENRPVYRLTGADLTGGQPRMSFTLGRFFDAVDVGGAAAHEYVAAELGLIEDRPLRAAVKDPCDLDAWPAMMAVGALTLRHDRTTGTASFPLHYRDPRRVGHAGGMFQVIPVGIFQPSGEAEWNVPNDFDLWRGLLREFAEELLGDSEDHGSETAPIDYDGWPFGWRITGALGDGQVRAWCVGLGADPLTFALDLLTVVVVDALVYDELFGRAVSDNAEGAVLPPRPFDEPTVNELLNDHPVQAAGAALLKLALAHKDALLAG